MTSPDEKAVEIAAEALQENCDCTFDAARKALTALAAEGYTLVRSDVDMREKAVEALIGFVLADSCDDGIETRVQRPVAEAFVSAMEAAGVVFASSSRLEEAERLLGALVDDDPCRLDHHGYCQTHFTGSAPCPVAEARAFLRKEEKDV